MQRRDFLRASVVARLGAAIRSSPGRSAAQAATRPKVLYLPTASADSQSNIITWYRSCAPIDVYPLVQGSFIARLIE